MRSNREINADYRTLEALCGSLGLELRPESRQQLEIYRRTILEWNSKINLISRRDEDRLVSYHFLDSAEGLVYLREIDTRVLDLGSGAGLPGIVWEILNPGLDMTLVESTRKRSLFLEKAVQTLGLGGTRVVRARGEWLATQPELRGRFDVAVARTVARLPRLVEICLPLLRPGGRLIAYKGAGLEKELDEAGQTLKDLRGEVVRVAVAASVPLAGKRVFVIVEREGEKTRTGAGTEA